MAQIIPCEFTTKGAYGDFPWMIEQLLYENCFFIFDDRIEFINSYKTGNGNAGVRPYTINNPEIIIPLAAGIPLASIKKGGFTSLSANKASIDTAFNTIKNIFNNNTYNNVYYPVRQDGKIATSGYVVSDDVRTYITEQIELLSTYL